MAPTWSFAARPEPVIAALTSLGVCRVTGMPVPRGDQHRDTGGLGRAHHGLHVVLGEHSLDRHRRRAGSA